MFGIGMAEMILICALALIVVGPDKLPDLARSVAKVVLDLKKTATGLKESITEEMAPVLDEVKPQLEEATKALQENISQQNILSHQNSDSKKNDETLSVSTDQESTVNEPQPNNLAMTTDELIERAKKIKSNSPVEENNA